MIKSNSNKESGVLGKLKKYVFPDNPVDTHALGRMKRGAIQYAHTGGRSGIPPIQRWLRRRSFVFHHGTNGSSVHVKVSAADLTHLWVADEVLAEKVYQLDVVPFTPRLVVDLGANIGLFTLLAAKRWPGARLVCVEPHPVTFGYLCDNLALNKVTAMKLQCAVDTSPSLLYLQNEGAVFQTLSRAATTTAALTIPLAALLPRDDCGDVLSEIVIKMDIEGAEESALNNLNATLPDQAFIFIELHRGDSSLAWIQQWSEKNNFCFTQVRRREEAIDGYLMRPRAAMR